MLGCADSALRSGKGPAFRTGCSDQIPASATIAQGVQRPVKKLWTLGLPIAAVGLLLYYPYGPDSLARDIDRIADSIVDVVPEFIQTIFGL